MSTQFLDLLRAMPGYGVQIKHVAPQAAREACYLQPERPLPDRLQAQLRAAGLDRLYSHQASALDATRRGEHVCIVTGTASGKSLCYLLPILEAVETHPGSTALLLFPTKALLHDQRAGLEKLTGGLPIRVGVYDGDSSTEDSRGARACDIVISNPDKIHRGLIPYATQGWFRFMRNLRFIVVDEAHTYSGVFGGHMGLVLRRLLRMCALVGSRPQVVCCSATIGNPAAHIQALTGMPAVTVIEENGAPSGPREFVFWETTSAGAVAQEALEIFLTLLQHEKQTLLFTAGRQTADRLLQEACSRQPQWRDRIAAYRAGHLPADRRRIEAGMRQGHLRGLISTNANELGVDIGALDAVVMCGYPGTVASFRQQAGRAGRSRQPALAVLVGGHTPLEAYYFAHPEALVTAPAEPAYLPTTNSHLLLDQVWCAAYDAPLSRDDAVWFGGKELLKKTIETLVGRQYLAPCSGREIGQDGAPLHHYGPGGGDAFPPMMVSLRGMTGIEFTLQDAAGQIIERGLTGLQMQREAHPGAIYYSHHKAFQITDIDYEALIITATDLPGPPDYTTQANVETHASHREVAEARVVGGVRCAWGDCTITQQVTSYQERPRRGGIGREVSLTLPPQLLTTQACWWELPPALIARLAGLGHKALPAMRALENLLVALLPVFSQADPRDTAGVLSLLDGPAGATGYLTIYDILDGGCGLTRRGYDQADEWLRLAESRLRSCPCREGCPACIHTGRRGIGGEPLDKTGALLLAQMMAGTAPQAARPSAAGRPAARPGTQPASLPAAARRTQAIAPPVAGSLPVAPGGSRATQIRVHERWTEVRGALRSRSAGKLHQYILAVDSVEVDGDSLILDFGDNLDIATLFTRPENRAIMESIFRQVFGHPYRLRVFSRAAPQRPPVS